MTRVDMPLNQITGLKQYDRNTNYKENCKN